MATKTSKHATGVNEKAMQEFYAGAAHSDELQARIEVMQGWNAKRLEMAVPAWAKPTRMPAPFKPQLAQKFPAWTERGGMPAPAFERYAFQGLHAGMTTAEYVARFDQNQGYRSVNGLTERSAA